jgi:ABC-2 type transport system permease protein
MSADSVLARENLGATGPGGVIHDRGYRRYDGPRLGRIQIMRALCWHSFRSSFGIGRGPKAKILPVIAFITICLPAIVNAFAVARGGSRIVPYGTYSVGVRVIVLTIFAAVQAPELISRDLRSRVMPLYFSRPMRRGDYPLAKYIAFTAACLVMIEVPLVLLYLGTIVSSKSGVIWSETRGLASGLAVGLMWAVLISAISLALASLSQRRAYATGTIAIFYFLTFTLAKIIQQISEGGTGVVSAVAPASQRLPGLISPFTTLDGIRQWFGGAPRLHPGLVLQGGGSGPGTVPYPGDYGPAYIVMFLVLLAASFAILAARYRKAAMV